MFSLELPTWLRWIHSESLNSTYAWVIVLAFWLVFKIWRARQQIQQIEGVTEDNPAYHAPSGTIVKVYIEPEVGSDSNEVMRRCRVPSITATTSGVLNCRTRLIGDQVQLQDQAVVLQCASSLSDVRFDFQELHKTLHATGSNNAFGEHVFVTGLTVDDVCVGDVWRVRGDYLGVQLQVTCPCKPTALLDKRHDGVGLANYCVKRGLGGWCCRVLKKGTLKDNDVLFCVKRPSPEWTLRRTARVLYGGADRAGNAALPEKAEDLSDLHSLTTVKWLAQRDWMEVADALVKNSTETANKKMD